MVSGVENPSTDFGRRTAICRRRFSGNGTDISEIRVLERRDDGFGGERKERRGRVLERERRWTSNTKINKIIKSVSKYNYFKKMIF